MLSSSCKAEIDTLRNDLKILNSTVLTKEQIAGSLFQCEKNSINRSESFYMNVCKSEPEKISYNQTKDTMGHFLDGTAPQNFKFSAKASARNESSPRNESLQV